MSQIIHRYYAGDKSLMEEIEANAVSENPLAQIARASLPENTMEDAESRKRKRVIEDADLQKVRIGNINMFNSIMSFYSPNWQNEDQRLVLQMQDHLKNVMLPPTSQGAITNGENSDNLSPITVSQVAQDMAKRLSNGQLIRAGRLLAERYRERHGKDPSKHKQFVDGAVRMVNSYTEQDRDLVEEVIEECLS